jgi:hypothetical protein
MAGQNVEHDVSGVDALRGRLGAGRLDRRQPVGEHRCEYVDHLPIAVVDAGELAPHPLHASDRRPQRSHEASLRETMRTITLLMAGALASCAATGPPQQWLDARAMCEQLAQASASSPALVSGDYVDRCMIARGYRPQVSPVRTP